MRTVSLDDVMNRQSVGKAGKKRNHGVGTVAKSFLIQRVAGDATVTTQRFLASQVTMMDAHLSCVRPDQTTKAEAHKPTPWHERVFMGTLMIYIERWWSAQGRSSLKRREKEICR